ncbi:ATP-binding protein [Bacteroidota bacterium]
MKRELYKNLLAWKNSSNRKPLLLQGARQVGKTYLISTFGRKEYSHFIHLNFEQDPDLRSIFTGNLNPKIIIENISLYVGRKINHTDTLIFFDEIQAEERAITSLKYFYEQAPEYHLAAAGSLLGVTVGKGSSFPVGKVNFMTLHPMSFAEYLMAFSEELLFEKLVVTEKIEPFLEIIHNKLLSHLKMHLFLGGMPEVLHNYLLNSDIVSARVIQNEILETYLRDFSKYSEKSQAIKTAQLWHSIPYQLAKENKKFKYSDVRSKARAAMFGSAIKWLRQAGLIHIVRNINLPKLPLSGYADHSKFKIYLLDTGLLAAMLEISSNIIVKGSELFSEYNGAFIENYATNEFIKSGNRELFYWKSKSDAEVDFIMQFQNNIYPVEVKSGKNRNLKSIRSYAEKYDPRFIFRTSPRNFIRDNDFVNIPLYALFTLNNIISSLTKLQRHE